MPSEPNLTEGLLSFVVFVYSTTLHEAAHAWSAWKLGDDTAYRGGQVSLDPVPHVRREPVGMVVVPIVSYLFGGRMFGWASAPYDPLWARQYPERSALMALAGPGANLLLVLLAGLGIRFGLWTGVFAAPGSIGWTHVAVAAGDDGGWWSLLAELASVLFSLNLLLFAFNLLPLPPLDGSCLPLLFLRGRAAEGYLDVIRNPSLTFLGLVLAWRGFGAVFPAIQLGAIRLLYPEFHYA